MVAISSASVVSSTWPMAKPWIISVTSGPTMCAPSNAPVFASKIVLTSPSDSPSAIALPLPISGKRPIRSSWPAALACSSVRPTLAICGWQ